jgi:hypothetical protein
VASLVEEAEMELMVPLALGPCVSYTGLAPPTSIYQLARLPSPGEYDMPASTREEKLENLLMNRSLILMGMFDEDLSAVAERMAGSQDRGGVTSMSMAEIEWIFSAMRDELASEWPKDPDVLKRYIADPVFDLGVVIVERYDLERPKLTERLTDEVLASYVFLLLAGDTEAGRMFKELADWQIALPRPPWET